METIDGLRLIELFDENNGVSDKNIELNFDLDLDISKTKSFSFRNCNFKGQNLSFNSFENKDYQLPILKFTNCNFHINQLDFSNGNFESIFFNRIYIQEYLSFNEVNITTLSIQLRCEIGILEINNLKVSKRFYLNKYNKIQRLLINDSLFENDFFLFNSTFEDIHISDSLFKNIFYFNKNTVTEGIEIERCDFLNSYFDSNKFSSPNKDYKLNLENNKFNGITSFSNTNASHIDLIINQCNFKKLARFNNSTFQLLHIEETNFNDISSFQDTNFYSVFIDRTNFDKTSYFDDISISNIRSCNKRTLRNIKHQLQRTNNKIDFDKFKSYEISAYREELKKDKRFWYNDKDAFILNLSNLFSNNGTNWFQALKVTVLGSFLFYSLFFWINVSCCQFGDFDLSNIDVFINGFTKFLIPTNIYNPLVDKTFVIGLSSWFPFIIGKIFLSIGIYEIIVSFRKFKG